MATIDLTTVNTTNTTFSLRVYSFQFGFHSLLACLLFVVVVVGASNNIIAGTGGSIPFVCSLICSLMFTLVWFMSAAFNCQLSQLFFVCFCLIAKSLRQSCLKTTALIDVLFMLNKYASICFQLLCSYCFASLIFLKIIQLFIFVNVFLLKMCLMIKLFIYIYITSR